MTFSVLLARSDDAVMVAIILNNVILICCLGGSVCTVNLTDRKGLTVSIGCQTLHFPSMCTLAYMQYHRSPAVGQLQVLMFSSDEFQDSFYSEVTFKRVSWAF